MGNSGGDRPKNLLAPISKPRITVPPVRTRPCTEDIGGIQMTIEGGEGSTSIFSTLDHDAVPTRNRSRRGGRDEFVNRSTGGSTYAARVRELERHQRVPRRGDVSTNGRCYQDVHNDRRIPRDDIRNADADDAPNRPPKDTSSPYRDAIGDDPTTYSERASARGGQRSPAALPTHTTDRYVRLQSKPSKGQAEPSRAPLPPTGLPNRTFTRRPTSRGTIPGSPYRPASAPTPGSRTYSADSPVIRMATCTSGTTSADPTSMPAGYHRDGHPDVRLEQPAHWGHHMNKIPFGSTLERALPHTERLDRIAERSFLAGSDPEGAAAVRHPLLAATRRPSRSW